MVPRLPSKHLSSAGVQPDGRFRGERRAELPNWRSAGHLLDLKCNGHLARLILLPHRTQHQLVGPQTSLRSRPKTPDYSGPTPTQGAGTLPGRSDWRIRCCYQCSGSAYEMVDKTLYSELVDSLRTAASDSEYKTRWVDQTPEYSPIFVVCASCFHALYSSTLCATSVQSYALCSISIASQERMWCRTKKKRTNIGCARLAHV